MNHSKTPKYQAKSYILIAIAILLMASSFFFQLKKPVLVADNSKIWFVAILPILLTTIAVILAYKKHIVEEWVKANSIWTKPILALAFMSIVFLFYFLFLYPFANMLWRYAQVNAANKNEIQIETATVVAFSNYRGNYKITIDFRGKEQDIDVARSFIQQYESENPANYVVTLHLRKGLGNAYAVEEFALQGKALK